MLRIAVQSKGRLFDDTMNLLAEADIKISASKRTLLVQSSNFPLEVLYLRDDDIPQSVASGVADIGVVGENEFIERGEDAVGQSDARADLHTACDDVYLCLDALLVEEHLQDMRIAGGNLLAVEPVHTTILNILGNGQRQAALREAKT